jgi:hypothetical protein
MFSATRNTWAWFLLWLFVPSLLMGVEQTKTSKVKAGKPASAAAVAPAENVELFKAIDAQQLTVQFVPNNAEVAHIFVTNVSKKPLAVQLPTVFAARPVLAQFQIPGGGQQNGQSGSVGLLQSGGQTPQMLTGVNPNGQQNNNNRNGAQPFFNIPPGKTVNVRVPVMCLQYGNPDPRPDIPYELVTLDSILKKPELTTMLEEFAAGKFDQPVAQLAAWHFSNGLSLEALANTGFAPGRMGEVARVIQHVRDKVKAGPATGSSTPAASGSSATAAVPSTGNSARP